MLVGQFGSWHGAFLDSTMGVISPGQNHVTLLIRDNRIMIGDFNLPVSPTSTSNSHYNNHNNNHNNHNNHHHERQG